MSTSATAHNPLQCLNSPVSGRVGQRTGPLLNPAPTLGIPDPAGEPPVGSLAPPLLWLLVALLAAPLLQWHHPPESRQMQYTSPRHCRAILDCMCSAAHCDDSLCIGPSAYDHIVGSAIFQPACSDHFSPPRTDLECCCE